MRGDIELMGGPPVPPLITSDDHNSFYNEHCCLLRENCCLFWGPGDYLNGKTPVMLKKHCSNSMKITLSSLQTDLKV